MADEPEPPATLDAALSDLKAAAERRRRLPHGSREYAVALAEEVALSQTVYELAAALRQRQSG